MNLKYIKKPIIGNPIVVLSAIITIGIAIRILFVPFDIPLTWDNFTYFMYAIDHSLLHIQSQSYYLIEHSLLTNPNMMYHKLF